MLNVIAMVFFWVFLISISSLLVIIFGTYLSSKTKGSRFDKWWRRNIVDEIPEHLED
jgi:hypothetical protein